MQLQLTSPFGSKTSAITNSSATAYRCVSGEVSPFVHRPSPVSLLSSFSFLLYPDLRRTVERENHEILEVAALVVE